MSPSVSIVGVNRVPKRLADGRLVYYHYAWRGGSPKPPMFWREPIDGKPGCPAYLEALQKARASVLETPSAHATIERLVDQYYNSSNFKNLAPRTQSDYRKWCKRFVEEFGSARPAALEDPRMAGAIASWRDRWAHSPKQAQYAWTVAKIIANFAKKRGAIKSHNIEGETAIYKADRAEIVWTSEEIEKLLAVAPEWVRRIAIAAASTGLRAGDLCKLSRAHIHGDVIQIRTNKRKRMATLPILPELRPIIEATPRNQMLILTSAKGRRLTEHRASEGLRQWGRKAGVNPELRLNDFRGTAATRLVRAGVPLDKVAACMGWSLRHAQSVIDNYVACDPKNAHDVLVILERERNRKLQTKLQTAHPKEG